MNVESRESLLTQLKQSIDDRNFSNAQTLLEYDDLPINDVFPNTNESPLLYAMRSLLPLNLTTLEGNNAVVQRGVNILRAILNRAEVNPNLDGNVTGDGWGDFVGH